MLTSFKNLHNAKLKHKFVICDAREMSQNLGMVFLFIDDNSKRHFFYNEAELHLTQNKSLQRGNASDNS